MQSWALVSLALAVGCGRVGFDPGPGGDGGGGDGGGDGKDAASCIPTTFACADDDLGTALGQISSGTTAGKGDEYAGSCGGAGEADLAFHWVVPAAGRYVLDTEGSGFDTVLYVRAACGGGAQLACNDDNLVSGNASSLTLDLEACRELLIVVDGLSGAGAYNLNVREKCPGTQAGSALGDAVATGSNLGRGDSYSSTCGGLAEADVAVTWKAPSTGTFRFTTLGSSFDTVLSARSACEGAVLICNDDDPGGGNHSVFELTLTKGQTIVLVIDSLSTGGTYRLGIREV